MPRTRFLATAAAIALSAMAIPSVASADALTDALNAAMNGKTPSSQPANPNAQAVTGSSSGTTSTLTPEQKALLDQLAKQAQSQSANQVQSLFTNTRTPVPAPVLTQGAGLPTILQQTPAHVAFAPLR